MLTQREPASLLANMFGSGAHRLSSALETPRLANVPSTSPSPGNSASASVAWSLYDDLYLDAAYDCSSESQIPATAAGREDEDGGGSGGGRHGVVAGSRRRARRWVGPVGAHLASGSWTLSREQGNKLLASRFRGDRLYMCEWPGCVHADERCKYMVFCGVFLDFAQSQVWHALRDTGRPTVVGACVFCTCAEAWDLHSAFCFRGYHDDSEPIIRAFVC